MPFLWFLILNLYLHHAEAWLEQGTSLAPKSQAQPDSSAHDPARVHNRHVATSWFGEACHQPVGETPFEIRATCTSRRSTQSRQYGSQFAKLVVPFVQQVVQSQCPILPELWYGQRQLYSDAGYTPALAGHWISRLGLAVEAVFAALSEETDIPETTSTRWQRRQKWQSRQDEGQTGGQRAGAFCGTWSVNSSTDCVFTCSTYSAWTGHASNQSCAFPRDGDENTPAEISRLLGDYQEDAHRATGKVLHKLVSKQQEARRGLSKTRADRATFDGAWATYLNHMAQLLEQQLTDRVSTLRQFDQAEEAWKTQLDDTTAELARHAATQQDVAEPQEPIDIDAEMEQQEKQEQAVAEAAQEEAKASIRREQQRAETDAKAQEMLQVLKNVQQHLETPAREGSRTPRRTASKDKEGAEKKPDTKLEAAAKVRFDMVGHSLHMDEDPRIRSNIEDPIEVPPPVTTPTSSYQHEVPAQDRSTGKGHVERLQTPSAACATRCVHGNLFWKFNSRSISSGGNAKLRPGPQILGQPALRSAFTPDVPIPVCGPLPEIHSIVGETPQQDRYCVFNTETHADIRFPATQLAITLRDAPVGHQAMPVDYRPMSGRICTVNVGPGQTADDIAEHCHRLCPPHRLPPYLYVLYEPNGEDLDAVPGFVEDLDFIRAGQPHFAMPPAPDGEQDEAVLLQTGFRQLQGSTAAQSKAKSPPLPAAPAQPILLPPSPRCPSQDREPPSLLKRRLSGEQPKATGGQWRLYPDALLGPRYTGVAVAYTTWGKPDDTTKHLFTVFDTRRHLSTISSNEAAKVAEFAQRAIDTAP
ncbi:unnamed protein product, partial [Symbiodinium necroappetens]